MINDPYFSIIIPIYNVKQDYLYACVESILKQSFPKFELILVDDGSPDNCGKICEDYAVQDKRVKVIHQRNQGVSAARNCGIAAATAEWVMFVDADDWIESGAYARLHRELICSDVEMLMFRAIKVFAKRQCTLEYGLLAGQQYNTNNIKDKELLYRLAMRPPQIGCSPVYYSIDKVFKRNFLISNKLQYPIGICKSEDKVFILRCLQKVEKLSFIDDALYYYRINSASACNRYMQSIDVDRQKLAGLLMVIAQDMDKEITKISGEPNYKQISADCVRFLFGIVSDVLLQKYYHKDCPLDKLTRKAEAMKFLNHEPFCSVIRGVNYSQLPYGARLKKLLLSHGWSGVYCSIYRIVNILQRKRPDQI